MTGATSTIGGGGGGGGRPLSFVPSKGRGGGNELNKGGDICFFISFSSIVVFLISFLSPFWRASFWTQLRLGGNVARESSRRFQARQSRDCTLLQRQIACQNRHEAK